MKKFLEVSAYAHRAAIQAIVIVTFLATAVTQFGPGFGVNQATITVVAAAAASAVTILRGISDATTAK